MIHNYAGGVFLLAMTTKPITVETVKKLLNGYKYMDDIISCYGNLLKEIDRNTQFCSEEQKKTLVPKFKRDVSGWIRDTQKAKADIMKLLEYADNDFDRELLWRRYIQNQDYYAIAYDIGYSESHTMRLYKDAISRLTANAAELPPFKY